MKAHLRNCISSPLTFVLISSLSVFLTEISYSMITNTPNEYISASFKNGFDTDVWNGTVQINRNLMDSGNLYLYQKLNVILHETRGFHREWKFDEQLEFNVTKTNINKFDFKLEGEYERFQDQRSKSFQSDVRTFPLLPQPDLLFQSPHTSDYNRKVDMSQIYIGVGAEYEILPSMKIDASVGPLFEERSGNKLDGTRFRFGLNNQVPAFGIRLRSDGWVDQFDSVDDNGFSVALSGKWTEIGTATDALNFRFKQSLQREFTPGSRSYNHRRDEEFSFVNRLSTDTSAPLQSVWTSELSRYRTIHLGSNADYMEFTWKNGLDFLWKYRSININTFGGIDIQEQKYPTSLSNGQRTRLGVNLHYYTAGTDSLVVESIAIRYRYDTPDDNDQNDRDEVRYKFAIHGGWKINSEYGIRTRLEADLRHFVYLFSQRSSENRWSRLFSFSVEIPWSTEQFENNSSFAIISNYSVYDFVPSKDELSRVYRSCVVNDTMRIKFTNHLSLELDFAGKIDDHGRLHWNKWIEDVSEDGYGYSLSVLPTFESSWYNFRIGWSWQERHTTLHLESDQTAEGESIRSNGPEMLIKSKFSPRLQGELIGRYLKVKDLQRGNYKLPDFRVQLSYSLG